MRVAIIPARGGSKRIPHKNTRHFCGKPIMAYPIGAARESGLFDRVIVSTDSADIAEVARRFGAEIPFVRPPELADDYTPTAAVVAHALEWFIGHGAAPSHFCCIYPTAPMVTPEFLHRGLAELERTGASVAFTVTTFAFPIFRALKLDEHNRLAMFWPEHHDTRSQDLPTVWHDAGQFYWGDTAKFLRTRNLYEDAVPVVLPRYMVQDIDTVEDWERAELMFQVRQNRPAHASV